MDAPPIPRLVDLVQAFNGVVVEQFKKKGRKTPQLFDSSLAIVKATFQNSTQAMFEMLNMGCVRRYQSGASRNSSQFLAFSMLQKKNRKIELNF